MLVNTMKKYQLAFVHPTYPNIYSSLANLLKVYHHLSKKKDVEVTIFTDSRNKVSYKGFKIQKVKGVDYKTPLEKGLFLLGLPRFFYIDLVEKLRGFDVIESSSPEFYGYGYQCFLAAKKYKSKLLYRNSTSVEGFFLYKIAKYFTTPLVKKAYDHAIACLFANPEAEQRCLRIGLLRNKEKSVILGHPTDVSCFKPVQVKKPARKILLSVGGLYEIKGHQLIIKSLRKIIDQGEDAELWIVGDGYYGKVLKILVDQLKLRDRVKFLGKQTHPALVKLYNQCTIFVLANHQEITPAVNEAWACEKPVVVMECGGCKFTIPSEDYGFVSKKFDVEDMTKKIMILLRNPKKARKMGRKGRHLVLQKFSVEKIAEKIYVSISK